MAKKSNDKKSRIVAFNDHQGHRQYIRLGQVNQHTYEYVKCRIRDIVRSKKYRGDLKEETVKWLTEIPDALHEKLAKYGIVQPRNAEPLEDFLKTRLAKKKIKDSTRKKYSTAVTNLVGFFGNVSLETITADQAENYREYLVDECGYSQASVSKEISIAKGFFHNAKKRRLVTENPFQDVLMGSQENKARQFYVTMEITNRLIDACADAKERLIIALARFAGLRIPSELIELKMSDLHWDKHQFIVHAPKTAAYEGKEVRIVPIFKVLEPYFLDACRTVPVGEDRIYPEIDKNTSKGSWIARLFKKAGVVPFPKPFVNMRSSCATDLSSHFPGYRCEYWLGHSAKIADKHYRQITDDHFVDAANTCSLYSQESATNGLGTDKVKTVFESGNHDANSIFQSATKSATAHTGIDKQINATETIDIVKSDLIQFLASICATKNVPDRTRTCNLWLRRPTLYPFELQGLIQISNCLL